MEPNQPLITTEEQFKIIADTAPVLIWIADTDKQFVSFNKEWFLFTGRTLQQESSNGWTDGIHPDDLNHFLINYTTAFNARQKFKIEHRLLCFDGKYRWVIHRGVPRYAADGTFTGYAATCMDIDEFAQSELVGKSFLSEKALRIQQTLNEELAISNEELVAINEELQQTQDALYELTNDLEKIVAERTQDLTASETKAQLLNTNLIAANTELELANREMISANEALTASYDKIRQANEQLSDSQHKTKSIVESAPFPIGVYIGKEMRIEFANQSILDVWGKGDDVIGKLYSDVLPELDNQQIFQQLDGVFSTGTPFHARNQRVDLVVNGRLKVYYFNYSFTPLYNMDGQVYGVMNTAADVTDVVEAKQTVEQSERNLHNMVIQAPVGMCILKGDPLYVTVINDEFLEVIGKERKQFDGTPYWDVIPEAAAYYSPITDHVLKTGETFYATEHEIMLIRKGREEIVHVDFVYEPIRDLNGSVDGLMIVAIDVTDKVLARIFIQQSAEELAAINEELAAANEELESTNEELADLNDELAAINEELTESKTNVEQINIDLTNSEARFRFFIQGAPVAIAILNGRELVIESANDKILSLWGKSKNIIGLPLDTALPELRGQPFLEILDNVFTSGNAFYGDELMAMLEHEGELKAFYFNFVYQPIKKDLSLTTDIMVVAIDVSKQVTSRREVERTEESLRMAIEAADLGSFHINLIDRILVASPKLKEFFGFGPDDDVPYQAIINQIHPDYRKEVDDLVETCITTGSRFDMEYPITGHDDGKIRWVRGIGTVQEDNDGVNKYFTGVLNDITERRQDEIRKNDFIGMVSHELKTPLTSLAAIVQVLHAKLRNSEDAFVPGALEKANTQVKKMSSMINGFLNISRLESGKISIDKHRFDLIELVHEVIKETTLTVSSHHLKFDQQDSIMLNADHDKIASVLTNLISNAVKYSPPATTIEINCLSTGQNVQVRVKDEGMGISPEDRENLFERYYRVEGEHTQHISGFGIGLYLSAEIIKRHDGNIWVESEKGAGSSFYFTLPI